MQGLFDKYIVHKADGTPCDEDAIYFVLRLDTDPFAQTAAHFYAFLCHQQNPALSADLLTLLRNHTDKEPNAIQVLRQVEWVQGGPGISESYCPSCYWAKTNGHGPDCALAALLEQNT